VPHEVRQHWGFGDTPSKSHDPALRPSERRVDSRKPSPRVSMISSSWCQSGRRGLADVRLFDPQLTLEGIDDFFRPLAVLADATDDMDDHSSLLEEERRGFLEFQLRDDARARCIISRPCRPRRPLSGSVTTRALWVPAARRILKWHSGRYHELPFRMPSRSRIQLPCRRLWFTRSLRPWPSDDADARVPPEPARSAWCSTLGHLRRVTYRVHRDHAGV